MSWEFWGRPSVLHESYRWLIVLEHRDGRSWVPLFAMGDLGYPCSSMKYELHKLCCMPLDRATSSASHEDVVFSFWTVDLLQCAPRPRLMHTPQCERISGCVANDASMNLLIFGGRLLRRVSAMLLVLPRQNRMLFFSTVPQKTNTSEVCATEIHPLKKTLSVFTSGL